jgi:hypothetical protein
MAATPTVADLQALIATLQAQVNALLAAAPAAAAPTPVVFADTPQTLISNDLIDYLTKRGSSIYEQGCKALEDKALTNRFGMTPNQTVVFVEALSHHATMMGWNQGTKQITTHQNSAGTAIDIIKCYGRIDKATLKASCECFCRAGEGDAETRGKQNSTMMASCLSKSLTAATQARLLICCNEYTFDGVEYAPLMYKVIMRLATINTVTTMQALQDNLQNLGTFSATVNGDIAKIHGEFDKNYSQLIAQGATLNDPIGILFEAYNIVPCTNFKKYIGRQYEDYLDGRLAGLTHKTLMTSAMHKYEWLQMKEIWGAKSLDNEKITAMAAEIQTLKDHLKANKKLGDALKEGGKRKKKGNSKTKNK